MAFTESQGVNQLSAEANIWKFAALGIVGSAAFLSLAALLFLAFDVAGSGGMIIENE